jgi:hypothetical protein
MAAMHTSGKEIQPEPSEGMEKYHERWSTRFDRGQSVLYLWQASASNYYITVPSVAPRR